MVYALRRMRVRAAVAMGVLLMAAALDVAPALGNSAPPPGVHIDPGSPAGKQYQIPIPAARQETSGSTGSANQQGSNPPLFGVGVTTPATSNPTVPATSASHRTSSKRTRTVAFHRSPHARKAAQTHRSANAAASATTPTAANSQRAAAQVGGSGWLPLVIGGAMVLVIGGGVGLSIRRKLSQP